VVVEGGEHVSIECDSQGTANWFIIVANNDSEDYLPENTRVESNTIDIAYVEKRNLGIYECQGHLIEYINGYPNKVKFFSRSHLIMGMCPNVIIFVH